MTSKSAVEKAADYYMSNNDECRYCTATRNCSGGNGHDYCERMGKASLRRAVLAARKAKKGKRDAR